MEKTQIAGGAIEFGAGFRRVAVIAALAVVAMLVLTVFRPFYSIDQGERGVHLRFGQVVGVSGPGLHGRIPLIDRVLMISVREEKRQYELSAYSRDQQPARLEVSVTYSLSPDSVARVYETYGREIVARVLDTQVPRRAEEVFGTYNAERIVNERAGLGVAFESAVREAVASSGLVIASVNVDNVDFSDAYEQSVEQRMQAEVEKQRAEAQAITRQTNADAAAYERRAEAEAEAHAVRVQGQAEAEAIRVRGDALRENPELVALTTAERWDGTLPTTMVPGGATPFISVSPAPR